MKTKLKERIKELYEEYCNNSYNKSDNYDYCFKSYYTEQEIEECVLRELVDLYTRLDEEIEEEDRLIYHDWDVIEPTIELILEEKDNGNKDR